MVGTCKELKSSRQTVVACPAHSPFLVPCLEIHPLCSGLVEGETLTVLTFPGSHFWDLGSACTYQPEPFPSLTLFSFPSMFLFTNSLVLCFPSPQGSPPFLFFSPGAFLSAWLPCHSPLSPSLISSH